MRFRVAVLAFLAFCLVRHPSAATPQWDIFELTVETAGPIKNPFVDVDLSAIFTHTAGNRSLTVDGFYDGESGGKQVFRVRFAPPERGVWAYKTVSNITDLNAKSGRLEVTAPVSRGGLVRKPTLPRIFFREDGSPYYPVNFGLFPHPNNLGGADIGPTRKLDFPSEKVMMAFIDLLGDNGINMMMDIRVLFQRCDAINEPSFYPPFHVIDPVAWKIDRDRFNLAYFQRLDRELARAKEKGLFYTLQILTSQAVQKGEFTWRHSFYNVANGGWLEDKNGDGDGDDEDEYYNLNNADHVKYIKKMLRYTLARTAGYWNVMYRIGGDTRNANSGRVIAAELAIKWFGHWRSFVRDVDPYDRPLTIGRALEVVMNEVGSDWNPIPDNTGAEIVACGGPAASISNSPIKNVLRAIAARGECLWLNPDYSRPVILYEAPPMWKRKDLYEMLRKAYWVAFASGYVWAWPDAHYEVLVGDPPRLFDAEYYGVQGQPPVLADLKRMSAFLADSKLDLARLAPLRRIVSENDEDVYALANPAGQYVAVFPFGGKAVLQLADPKAGRYDAQFFNPRTGEYQPKTEVSGGPQSFTAPDNQDWVLVVRKK
ncbi:MAG: DUF5060 domain-containing protein [Acidobacteria bacterium]|nr:MAG: DUF5060 domain-containing protein [Acidobacteriota bacterium]